MPVQIVALYGPPGAGKSTLVRLAASRGIDALDAEELGASYETRRDELHRQLSFRTSGLVIVGAADLRLEDFPGGTQFVLLLPSREELEKRVIGRGDERKHKWIEHAFKVRDEHAAMRDQFDLVIESDLTPDTALNQIIGSL